MGRQATAVAAERAPEALGQVEEASSHRLARAAADLVAVREVARVAAAREAAREAARVAVAMEAAPVADRAPAAGSDCHLACEVVAAQVEVARALADLVKAAAAATARG